MPTFLHFNYIDVRDTWAGVEPPMDGLAIGLYLFWKQISRLSDCKYFNFWTKMFNIDQGLEIYEIQFFF